MDTGVQKKKNSDQPEEAFSKVKACGIMSY